MADSLSPVRFSFDGGTSFDGLADGTTWNGFDNVKVTPAVRDAIASSFVTDWPDDPDASDSASSIRDLPTGTDGLVDLSGGWATVVDRSDS